MEPAGPRLGRHESHDEGCFSVSNNTITRHAASYTTNTRFVAFLGTFARPAQQVWLPGNDLQDPSSWVAPPSARSNVCTGTSCSSTTAPSSRQWHSPSSRPRKALLPTQMHTCSLMQAPRTTATASSSYRNSTGFIWHSSGVRCPPRCLPALRLSGPAVPASPEVHHPYPLLFHRAAHQVLGALKGPASALRRHALR